MSPAAEKINEASKSDVIPVFNWGGLDPNQKFEVLSSYDSPAHFMGDYLRHYCIQASEFTPKKPEEWVRGPETNELYVQARNIAANTARIENCFGPGVSSNSTEVSAYIWQLRATRNFVTGVEIIMYHVPTKRILYVGLET